MEGMMKKDRRNPRVDFYFLKAGKWQQETEKLRSILLDLKVPGGELTEVLKWGCPCYTFDNKNIVLIHTFKDYCALLFFKGALISDKKGLLIRQTKNVQAARQIRFTGLREVIDAAPAIGAYVKEAVQIEKKGLKVEMKKSTDFPMAEEFRVKLEKMPALKKAFSALTPGRQRGYLLYFSSAKLPATRAARVEKTLDRILAGKGLDDA